jgi:proteasome lid subunit RPN8/RPN11
LYEAMIAQARAELPNECCGFLAGRIIPNSQSPVGIIMQRFPLVNSADDPGRRYEAEAGSLFQAWRDSREHELDILAIYHSHPTSDPIPSRVDQELSYWPEVVSLIISLKADDPCVRGWWVTESGFQEAEWRVVTDEA